jgi:DNA helicase II / ATP-dependent DNA helicase PcrA
VPNTPSSPSSPTPRTPAQETPISGLESDEAGACIVREELKLLATVYRALDAAGIASADAAKGRELDEGRMLELREEVATAKPEDLPALFEQMHHLGALRAQRGRGAVGAIDRASPYFGHLRLDENGRRRDVLVGSKSYVDSNAGVRIVDWRQAPVSRIYYRYVENEDYEETLGDKSVEGVVRARRSVAIVAGELVRVACPEGTFLRAADGAWRRIETHASRLRTERKWTAGENESVRSAPKRLGIGADGNLRADKHLPAIASLLDTAQFELIAKPAAGLVAIQGSAGSGKTTVGLHRVAYLAFTDPVRFRPDKMLVVVPHEALVHYVSRVLPSLDVEGVGVTTFERMARRLVQLAFPKIPVRICDETPPVVSRAKMHPAMLRSIDAAAERVVAALDTRIKNSMARWPDGDVVVTAWASTRSDPTLSPDARVTMLAQWAAGKRAIDSVAPASRLPDVTRSALERLGHDMRGDARAVLGTWDEILTSRDLLAETFRDVSAFGPGQLDQVHAWCVRQARIRQESDRDGEVPTLDAEDDALLLRIWQRLRGPLLDEDNKPIRYAHIFIDEVQDGNPIALRLLLDMAGKDRCVTLAGDLAQRMLDEGDDRGEFDWERLLRDLDVPHTVLEPLQVSYRSTSEITSFARSVLGPNAHDAEPIATRHGPPVELFTFASPGEAVAFLADALKELLRDEPYANVALVARFGAQADVYYEGLVRAELPNVRRVREQDFTWEPGVDVTDVRQTKGLEFDEVVLLDTNAASYPATPQARHALYVGATRAAHQLWCVASDKPSQVVVAAHEAALSAASNAAELA